MRRVLFIAYNFPPHGGPGVQRTTKFVKYLRQFGWQPVVVTTSVDASEVRDASLIGEIPPGTEIVRVPAFNIGRLMTGVSRYGLRRLCVAVNVLLALPDAARFWARRVAKRLPEIVARTHPDLIYTTSGPYSAHLVGLWTRKALELPWFVDFRDPWSTNLLVPYPPGYRALNRWMERRVVAQADRVACVSHPWLADLKRNSAGPEEKFLVLPNGYDETDVQPLPRGASTERFTITYTGSFYPNRKPDAFVDAVTKLVDSGRVPSARLRALFIGQNVQRYVPDRPPFEAHGYLPHRELGQFRAHTDAFLLILDTVPQNVGNHSGKLFEYLASNRPILGIVPRGGVAEELISRTRTGLLVDNNADAIASGVADLYEQWKSGSLEWNPRWDIIHQYTRRNLTARLATEFDRMVEGKQGTLAHA